MKIPNWFQIQLGQVASETIALLQRNISTSLLIYFPMARAENVWSDLSIVKQSQVLQKKNTFWESLAHYCETKSGSKPLQFFSLLYILAWYAASLKSKKGREMCTMFCQLNGKAQVCSQPSRHSEDAAHVVTEIWYVRFSISSCKQKKIHTLVGIIAHIILLGVEEASSSVKFVTIVYFIFLDFIALTFPVSVRMETSTKVIFRIFLFRFHSKQVVSNISSPCWNARSLYGRNDPKD